MATLPVGYRPVGNFYPIIFKSNVATSFLIDSARGIAQKSTGDCLTNSTHVILHAVFKAA